MLLKNGKNNKKSFLLYVNVFIMRLLDGRDMMQNRRNKQIHAG